MTPQSGVTSGKTKPAGWYSISTNDFINIDGSRGDTWQLPPGVEPEEVEHAEVRDLARR